MSANEQGGGPVTFQIEGGPAVAAFVIHVELPPVRGEGAVTRPAAVRDAENSLAEAVGLAAAIELDVRGTALVSLSRIVPATLLGRGKVEDLDSQLAATDTDLVIVNTQLTPVQQRNLERAWRKKVLDRTGLILEIFGRRARTREGRLQVELAHLTYQKSRLVRSWTHLERQRGGAGFLGGPGETQIEADRRVIQERIGKLQKQLTEVKRTRALHRDARARVPYPVVALVGYTNAGKSTLFNVLTEAGVKAKDQLFATLDPTMRQLELPHGRKIILSDTVGFIDNLPTTLVAAFRATLEEVLAADVIVHVRDISHDDSAAQAGDVLTVLEELGVSADRRDTMIEAWNKTDRLTPERLEALQQLAGNRDGTILTSARTGDGLDDLLAGIEARLGRNDAIGTIRLRAEEGAELSWFYRFAEVLDRKAEIDGTVLLKTRLDEAVKARARRRFGKRLQFVARQPAGDPPTAQAS